MTGTVQARTFIAGNSLYFNRKDGRRVLLASYLAEQITDTEYDRQLFCDGLYETLFDMYEEEGEGLIFSELEELAEALESLYRN